MAELADGLYEHVITGALAVDLAALEGERQSVIKRLDSADSDSALARHLATEVERVLASLPNDKGPDAQVAVVNALLDHLQLLVSTGDKSAPPLEPSKVAPSGERLLAIHRGAPPVRPQTPLASTTLLTRAKGEPTLGGELTREVASADRIDMLVAFITMGGVRQLRDALEAFARHSNGQLRLRVLTTVFTQTTELEAVELLAKLPGTQVKISYDTRRTRLHAKAWLFYRDTGLHTAYVGSANLTSTALGSGQEWMVKTCAADLPHVIDKFKGTFDSLWHDSEFEDFDPSDESCRDRLRKALAPRDPDSPQLFFSLRPFPFQQELLDRLTTERKLHKRHRNLVVAATGTGKTVVAAFDYARQLGPAQIPPRLLFLAHRRELLEQARITFRHALHDGGFGELLTGGDEPTHWDHVFATIQSAASRDLLGRFGPEHFQFVVVDECHHVPAESYRAIVPLLKPQILLGLTATPERADGKSLLPDFDGHIAAELRLWHALEGQLLVPFEYYGISDNTDLRDVRWTRNGYDQSALGNVYSGNDARADLIVRQLQRRVANLRAVRALAFCVSVEHAEFMAAALTRRGVPATAVHGATSAAARAAAPSLLRRREVNVLCTCDIYNEGIDLPFVDTLLLLRPTQSATLFLQQLGRGLRLDEGKSSCVVLDFIGQHRAEFRFDSILSAITAIPRTRLLGALNEGLPLLPRGCAFQLDAVARDQIILSLQRHLRGAQRIVSEVKELATELKASPRLANYLHASGRELEEVYAAGGWTTIRRSAGLIAGPANDTEDQTSARLQRLLHVDDRARLGTWLLSPEAAILSVSDVELARLTMLSMQLESRGTIPSHEATAKRLASPNIRQELIELCEVLDDRIALPEEVFPEPDWPLALHRHYSRFEIAAAIGYKRPGQNAGVPQGGIYKHTDQRELLFVTLDKSGKSFSPTTRYRDYAIAPDLFHWETQSIASVTNESGKRYIDSRTNGWRFFLFVRTDPDAPFAYCGPVVYQSHEGDRPIGITWKLQHVLPAALFQRFATLEQG